MGNGHHHDQKQECPLMPETEGIKEIRSLLKEALMDISEIKTAITGNTKLGIQGLVKRMDTNDAEVAALKKWRDNINLRVAYTSGLVSGAAFGILEGAKELLKSLFHHAP